MARNYPILLALVSLFLFSTCKKGEDDPFISLKSRKARIEGEWRLGEGTVTLGSTNITQALRFNQVFTLDGSRFKVTETGQNITPVTRSGVYMLNLKCDKKGNFTLSEIFETRRFTAEGLWNFSNTGDEKRKEGFTGVIKNISSSRVDYHLFNQGGTQFRYRIKALRDKEMVLTADLPIFLDANGFEQSFYGEFTLIQ